MGIFGGMFDPPHVGHVALARTGVEHFELDRLLVRVVADPGHRTVETPAEIRLQLAAAAFAGIPGGEVALDPCARTVDSLELLGLDDPVFLVGADEFSSFLTWKDPARVLELARLGVATRPGYSRDGVDAVLRELARPERVVFFEIEPLAVSSSAIRRLVAAGEPIDGLVPPAVALEVKRLRLYRGSFKGPEAG